MCPQETLANSRLVLQGPETLREISFAQTFGRDLADARESCRRYRQYGQIEDLNHAWDLYYQVRRFSHLTALPPSC